MLLRCRSAARFLQEKVIHRAAQVQSAHICEFASSGCLRADANVDTIDLTLAVYAFRYRERNEVASVVLRVFAK